MSHDTFNLVDEPWIPILEGAGGPLRLRSLGDVLCDARELREIWSPSPLETIALYRLLLAVLHAALRGPVSIRGGGALLRDGWPVKDVQTYLARWHERFELFHPERPFFQVAQVADGKLLPITRLAHESASKNNPRLFDHSRDCEPRAVTPGAAARLLVSHQLYALASGPPRSPFYDAPLARKLSVIVRGNELRTTLAANLVRYADQEPMAADQDAPVWEQDVLAQPNNAETTQPRGYLDYLTWQSRAICLRRDEHGNVSACSYRQNLRLASGLQPDPLVPYRRDDRHGLLPLQVQSGRALWRDAHAVLAGTLDPGLRGAPNGVLGWLSEICDAATRPRGLLAGGIATDQAKVEHWVMARLPVSSHLLHDETAREGLREAIARGELGERALDWGAREVATLLIAPASGEPGAAVPKRRVVAPIARSLRVQEAYWPALEPAFDAFAGELSKAGDLAPALSIWTAAVRRQAQHTFATAMRALDSSARSLRARAAGERVLAIGLSKVDPPSQEAAA